MASAWQSMTNRKTSNEKKKADAVAAATAAAARPNSAKSTASLSKPSPSAAALKPAPSKSDVKQKSIANAIAKTTTPELPNKSQNVPKPFALAAQPLSAPPTPSSKATPASSASNTKLAAAAGAKKQTDGTKQTVQVGAKTTTPAASASKTAVDAKSVKKPDAKHEKSPHGEMTPVPPGDQKTAPVASEFHISSANTNDLATLVNYHGIPQRRFKWFLRSNAEANTPCQYTGLTPIEKRALQDTWKVMHRDLKGNSVEFFVRYFVEHSEFCPLFPGMISAREVHKNHTVRKHAQQTMEFITCAVDNVWQPENVEPIMMRVGRNHAHYNCPPQSFAAIPHVMVEFLTYKLGKLLSSQAVAAWANFLDGMMSIIVKGLLAEYEWQQRLTKTLGPEILSVQTNPLAFDSPSATALAMGEDLPLPTLQPSSLLGRTKSTLNTAVKKPPAETIPTDVKLHYKQLNGDVRFREEELKVANAVEAASALYMRQMSQKTHEILFPVRKVNENRHGKAAKPLNDIERIRWATAAKQFKISLAASRRKKT